MCFALHIEIRSQPIHKHIGKRIALAASGTSAIFGWVELVECLGPLSQTDWHAMRDLHCVGDAERPYGESTYAYVLRDPRREVREIPFERKDGAVIWQDVEVAEQTARLVRVRREEERLRDRNQDGAIGFRLGNGPCAGADEERKCLVSAHCLGMEGCSEAEPRVLRCCGKCICTLCMRACLQQQGTRWGLGYSDARGREVQSDAFDAHRCPQCRTAMHSPGRAFM